MRYISCPLKLHRAWQCDQWVINGTTFVLVATNTSFFSLQYFSWRLNLKTLRVSWPQGFFLQVKPCFSFKGQIYYSFERVEQFSRARDVFFAIGCAWFFFSGQQPVQISFYRQQRTWLVESTYSIFFQQFFFSVQEYFWRKIVQPLTPNRKKVHPRGD